MYYVDVMMAEHMNIKRALEIIRKYCLKVLRKEDIDYDDFFALIDFVRNYADKHHHGKEEDLLFGRMVEQLGAAGEKVVKNGMLVEHDLGRLYMTQLEEAVKEVMSGNDDARVNVIANAIGYADLLKRHIDKENDVVYVFAMNNLPQDVQKQINEECEIFEEEGNKKGIQAKYTMMLDEFEKKLS